MLREIRAFARRTALSHFTLFLLFLPAFVPTVVRAAYFLQFNEYTRFPFWSINQEIMWGNLCRKEIESFFVILHNVINTRVH